MSTASASASQTKEAWVAFPGRVAAYTHAAALEAARSTLVESKGWRVFDGLAEEPADVDSVTVPPTSATSLYLADYDLLPFDELVTPGSSSQCSSYVIRKALIRKHHLATVLHAHSAKLSSSADEERRKRGAAVRRATPRTWCIDVQFADELDELLMDDLYDLREELEANEALSDASDGGAETQGKGKKWFILKPGMADRGNGIRLFSNADELREIFEGFEEDSDDEDEEGAGEAKGEDEEDSTGIMTSQLRHFVIQDYISRPLLVSPTRLAAQAGTSDAETLNLRKFHLRAYVLCVGSMSVYLYDDMLALFAPEAYVDPDTLGLAELGLGDEDDDDDDEGRDGTRQVRDWKRSALTNTCLHDSSRAGEQDADQRREAEDNVHLFRDLAGASYAPPAGSGRAQEKLSAEQIEQIRRSAANVIGMAFESAAKAGSVHFQTWPHAFEIFGVDLLVGWDGAEPREKLNVWLLEINAQPDFAQSGPALHKVIVDLFKRCLELAVLEPHHPSLPGSSRSPGGEKHSEGDAKATWNVGESREGVTLCFDEKLSGAW